jgi:hypothetical protein
VKYLPPFDLIRRSVEISTVRGELRVAMSYETFIDIIKKMIAGIEVNEQWYAETYQDIGEAISAGRIASAKHHFIEDGYFEGRLPFPVAVDEIYYQQKYPDVAESVRRGVPPTIQQHFEEDGYREGRLPFAL